MSDEISFGGKDFSSVIEMDRVGIRDRIEEEGGKTRNRERRNDVRISTTRFAHLVSLSQLLEETSTGEKISSALLTTSGSKRASGTKWPLALWVSYA